jgi:hypothetical protein
MEPVQKRLKLIYTAFSSMRRINQCLFFLFAIALLASSLILIQSASSQSSATPAVTEFTLQLADHSHSVPPQPTSSKDPYTGQVTSSTIPGYRVENITIDATITNPPGATYYNFRWKGSYDDTWQYAPYGPASGNWMVPDAYAVPFKASDSATTTLSLYFINPEDITPGGSIDVQVQALYGNFSAVPYVHVMPVGGPTYDFYFEGQVSDWSSTQTYTREGNTPASTPTPQPTIPEVSIVAVLSLLAIMPIAVAMLKKRSGLVKNH